MQSYNVRKLFCVNALFAESQYMSVLSLQA